MILRSVLLISLAGVLMFMCSGTGAQRRVRRQNMKVRINATGDTIVMKFVRPNPDVKLEGYILGYGSSMFSKQFIQLPENGEPYETEIDAEPKYLVAVQPIPTNDVKKHCTGKVNLDKPLHLVIGSVTPTSVLLSWGTFVKTPYEGNIMNECLEDGFYTIRYRERNRKWNYQTCPTSDTVIDNLKPNTPYEFGVRSNKDDRSGIWSKPVIHNTNMGDKSIQKPIKPSRTIIAKPMKPVMAIFPPRPALHNRTQPRLPFVHKPGFPGAPRTPFESPQSHQDTVPNLDTNEPQWPQFPLDTDNHVRNASSQSVDESPALVQPVPTKAHSSSSSSTSSSSSSSSSSSPSSSTTDPIATSHGDTHQGQGQGQGQGQSQTRAPSPTQKPHIPPGNGNVRTLGSSSHPSRVPDSIMLTRNLSSSSSSPHGGRKPFSPSFTKGMRNPYFPRATNQSNLYRRPGDNNPLWQDSKPHILDDSEHSGPSIGDQLHGPPLRPAMNKKTNLVGKPGGMEKLMDLKQDKNDILKPKLSPATPKPTKQERKTTPAPATNANRSETWETSPSFSAIPASEVDALGKKRYIAPHVVYKTDKKPEEPCSITTSLTYFPEDEGSAESNVTAPPRSAPQNLTVVTVEGCPSFVILDWEKADNDTTEYEVISTTKGPDGEQVSILRTNQTHTAVENLRPESSYEFKVKPKNELGAGPSSEPVAFNTESADPRVSENVSGKDAIWTQFPFKTDSFSECNGKQYVKRTWYRKFVGVQICNSLRYKIYLSDSLNGKFYNIGDQTGHGEDHCQFVDSFLDGRTGSQVAADTLPAREGYYRAMRQEPVNFGHIGGNSHITYVSWYECGTPIPGKW
ncbi:ABI family, member 3 (NESH) binding protein b isoform X2 [Engraulis encrasicolus]|uniref:ABI family, member 3 (NESH) binding protein b isoform X2 n=1 Tax=Engraulis encrasicolus TaxID=184585 RepID=UPI002FD632D5